jgi:hypothetical protein
MSQQHAAPPRADGDHHPHLRLVHQAEDDQQARAIRRLLRAAVTLAIVTLAVLAYTFGWPFVHIVVESVLIVIALGLATLIAIILVEIFKESD